ncbi:guanylate kinase [Subtercola boreus]|uniref:Guanylate kinase n=1 Tax=Subtercola boreus TaxID=120213 RepID=A0A3E0WEF0_9MICO|nr:guanylate kinase [Subtercola boreus]RFA21300.1 guanylate kinase [Subtercola boreus]RFA21683.1 guanylate kinase [Subtercola boreus]RFA27652.1 guanylate kinase [Subtercola boreus]
MKPPEVDRVAASKAAVAARRARAAVKNEVIAGRRAAVDVATVGLAEADSVEAGLRVRDLLLCIPGLGPVRVDRMLDRLDISRSKRVGGLGRHQRERLVEYLGTRAPTASGAQHPGPGHPAPAAAQTRLVVLAGPTAVGKGTVSTYIRENYPEVKLSVSATTRAPRPGEIDGVSYFFVTDEEFDRMTEAGEFLEWAVVHNQSRYGTPRGPVQEALDTGRSVLLEIDIQGARQVRASMPEAVLVFLLPPTWEELVRRLIGRGTESSEEQARRLSTAKVELKAQNEFDHRVVNNRVEDAAREVVDLMNISARPAPA